MSRRQAYCNALWHREKESCYIGSRGSGQNQEHVGSPAKTPSCPRPLPHFGYLRDPDPFLQDTGKQLLEKTQVICCRTRVSSALSFYGDCGKVA